jgi:hypothetical protein
MCSYNFVSWWFLKFHQSPVLGWCAVSQVIAAALAEDAGDRGDITTLST